jgi:hypothetical protein
MKSNQHCALQHAKEEVVMNLDATYGFQGQKAIVTKTSRTLARLAIRLDVILLLAATAYAQYGGGGGTTGGTTGTSGTTGASTTPGYGHGKAIGIGVGAAAAGVAAVYLMTHRPSKITGCVQMADDGLHLTDEKSKRTLALLPGPANINPGERVELKGKIRKDPAGDQSFLVKSVAKDFGACRAQASTGAAIPVGSK